MINKKKILRYKFAMKNMRKNDEMITQIKKNIFQNVSIYIQHKITINKNYKFKYFLLLSCTS